MGKKILENFCSENEEEVAKISNVLRGFKHLDTPINRAEKVNKL